MALRPIAAGEAITTNYLGSDATVAAPMRQAILLFGKLFRCACSRCTGPDLVRVMPCILCHPRPLAYPMEAGASCSYVVPYRKTVAAADEPKAASARPAPVEWRCETCNQQWSDRQLQALSAGIGGKYSTGGEFALSGAVYRHVREWLARPLDDFDAARLQDDRRRFLATRRAVGNRHWATAHMAKLIANTLRRALATGDEALLERLGVSSDEAAAEVAALSSLCRRFCDEASVPHRGWLLDQ